MFSKRVKSAALRQGCTSAAACMIGRMLPARNRPNIPIRVQRWATHRTRPDSNSHRQNHTKRFCNAYRTAFVRSLTPSLEKMLETWFLTVPSLILSAFAISRLLIPLVINFSTSVSRSVRSSEFSKASSRHAASQASARDNPRGDSRPAPALPPPGHPRRRIG